MTPALTTCTCEASNPAARTELIQRTRFARVLTDEDAGVF